MGVIIRNMMAKDIKGVQDVAKKTWNATYEGIIPSETQEKFLNSAYSDEQMNYRLNNSLLLVAEMEGRVVGFANYSSVNQQGEAELGAIYIYPEYQGKGIGSALLEKGIAALIGVRDIYVHVEKDNTVGKTFYEAKGFKKVSEFDDPFDGHLLKTLKLVLHLNTAS